MRGAHTMLRAEMDVAKHLPHPEHTWVTADVPNPLGDRVRRYHQYGVVRRVERGGRNREQPSTWETTRPAFEYVNDVVEKTHTPGPCDHKGVRNLGGGEYSCTTEDCEARFSREIAEARL
jgi:hypothetical protein